MAQKDPSRTEHATPKRVNEARKKGSVAKSVDLTKVILLIMALVVMRFAVENIGDHLTRLIRHFCGPGLSFQINQTNIYTLFISMALEMGAMILPIMLVLAITAYSVLRLQVGKLWSPKALSFKLPNVNPFAGIQRIMNLPKALIRMGREALQATAVGTAVYIVLRQEQANLLPLFYQEAEGMASYILETCFRMVKYAIWPMIIIGIADLLYNKYEYNENLKMTKPEVKDERKQMEGDPIIKRKQMQKMFGIMQQRMLQNVPKADVIITNPTHIAVALAYDPMQAPAPIVIAKGVDHLAEKIKDIARENSIPIRENKPLARALYKNTEVGDTIPEDLYKAVAVVLAQLQKFKKSQNLYR